MFYIDGINLKSIGNILCFVGIIIAILGVIYPWYVVSADISAGEFETAGVIDMITIDGLEGIQIYMPQLGGPIPSGALLIPFAIFIVVGIILMILF